MPRLAKPGHNPFHSSMIVVDSREALPIGFPGATTAALPTGDYSLLGAEHRITLERKTLADFYACVGRERKRFEKELERLVGFEYAAVIIEASLANLLQGYEYSRVHPHSAIGSVLAWSVKYNRLPFFFADNRKHCRAIIYRLLKKFYEYHITESNTDG